MAKEEGCIFCDRKQIEPYKVWENDSIDIVISRFPAVECHFVLITKFGEEEKHVSNILELCHTHAIALQITRVHLARYLQIKANEYVDLRFSDLIGQGVGQQIPHPHCHLFGLREGEVMPPPKVFLEMYLSPGLIRDEFPRKEPSSEFVAKFKDLLSDFIM